MKIKIITTDKPGVISLTPNELQELLNEAYMEGYKDKGEELNIYTATLDTTTISNDNLTVKSSPYITYTTRQNNLGTSISTIGGTTVNEI